jgi:hypothetical protein
VFLTVSEFLVFGFWFLVLVLVFGFWFLVGFSLIRLLILRVAIGRRTEAYNDQPVKFLNNPVTRNPATNTRKPQNPTTVQHRQKNVHNVRTASQNHPLKWTYGLQATTIVTRRGKGSF